MSNVNSSDFNMIGGGRLKGKRRRYVHEIVDKVTLVLQHSLDFSNKAKF